MKGQEKIARVLEVYSGLELKTNNSFGLISNLELITLYSLCKPQIFLNNNNNLLLQTNMEFII